jgi:hypothetical protein
MAKITAGIAITTISGLIGGVTFSCYRVEHMDTQTTEDIKPIKKLFFVKVTTGYK